MRLSFLAFVGSPQRVRLSFLNIGRSFPAEAPTRQKGNQPRRRRWRNTDARKKRSGSNCNFIHYEVDDEEVATVLRLQPSKSMATIKNLRGACSSPTKAAPAPVP